MACVNPDGTLSPVAQRVLDALRDDAAPADVARAAGVPLYRVRASVRELAEAGLLVVDGERWTLTAAGISLAG